MLVGQGITLNRRTRWPYALIESTRSSGLGYNSTIRKKSLIVAVLHVVMRRPSLPLTVASVIWADRETADEGRPHLDSGEFSASCRPWVAVLDADGGLACGEALLLRVRRWMY